MVGKASFTGTFDRAMFVNGEYRSPEGITYTGSFSSFRMMQGVLRARLWVCTPLSVHAGTGRIVYADQSQYNGAVRDNVREGQGVTEYADGSRLEGQWKGGGGGTDTLTRARQASGVRMCVSTARGPLEQATGC